MGQSTDAYFFFGIVSNEDANWIELARALGVDVPSDGGDDEYNEENAEEAIREYIETLGLELDTHCSCDCPMPFIYATQVRAWRGDATRIRLEPISSSQEKELERLFEKLKDSGWMKPAYYLASMWC